jgi:SAM-dependent methyltransferase
MIYEFLKQLREEELEEAKEFLRLGDGRRLLEIGAGAGWQAREFSGRGFRVEAVDVEGSDYESERVWAVHPYDGKQLPYADCSFDVVFTSHVLLFLREGDSFQKEIWRVTKPGGIAVHVLPSAPFAFWNIFLHYVFVARMLFYMISKREHAGRTGKLLRKARESSLPVRIIKAVVPHAMFADGNFLTQLYFFSRFYWTKLFREQGWTIVKRIPIKIYCSGYTLLGLRLGFPMRRRLSRVLGGSSTMYILAKGEAS